jgi:hypothetical protein
VADFPERKDDPIDGPVDDGQHAAPADQKLSWGQGFKEWLKDPGENRFKSALLKVVFFGGSVTVFDDLIPFIGQLDNPAIPAWLVVVAYGVYKINKHRDPDYGKRR